MATRTAARNASRSRTTEQTKAAFEELARKNRNKPVVSAKEQEARTTHAKSVLTDVSSLTAESAVKKVTEAGLTINDQKVGFAVRRGLAFDHRADEFAAILPQLYAKGYVLVSPHELYEVGEDDVVRPKTLMVPENRTPLVFSLDDCSYYLYMEGDGFADRLIVDEDGRVRNEYTDADGTTHVGSYDMVPMLDDFLEEHPDFSLNGARGVLAMTGYDGVFGYRTSAREFGDSPTFDADVAAATEVADAMKATGWEFASHTWGHRTVPKLELDELQRDLELWHGEVEPILGPTDMMIYPFGADVARTGKYEADNERYQYMRSLGYRSFFLVDGTAKAWGQLEPGYYRGSRINVDGISLEAAISGKRPVLDEFFDSRSVLDPARPASIRGTQQSPAAPPGGQSGSPSPSATG